MFNYIRAELYRNINRAYLWVYTVIVTGFLLLLNILFAININHMPGISLTALLATTVQVLTIPVFLVIAMLDVVTAEEQKNQTMRNVITFGFSRFKLVISKLIATTILAFVCGIIILAVFYGSGAILFGLGDGFSKVIPMYFERMLIAVPLWLGAISVGTFLALVIKNSAAFGFAYAGIFLFVPSIINFLSIYIWSKFQYVHKVLITTQLDRLKLENLGASDLVFAAVVGIVYTIIFTLLTMLYFKNKEVK